jgi:type II secretory pathway pseudopilin PulG
MMIHRTAARSRSGITLTEILISILILGVGVTSLATLFPLGLIRMRTAQRLTRGAFLVESAIADLGSRNLLFKPSFTNPYVSPWYQTTTSGRYDPFLVDTPSYGADWGPASAPLGANKVGLPGAGLPVAYDPLLRAVTGSYPNPLTAATPEARFGSGIGFLRNDPVGGGLPSAHGLQRLSNFQAALAPFPAIFNAASAMLVQQNYVTVLQTFVSPEDVIMQDSTGKYNDITGAAVASPSPLVPDLSGGSYSNDWRFSFLFTGQQSDTSDGSIFDGDIVICENRPFGIEQVTGPYGTTFQISGETVVEAIWNPSTTPGYIVSGTQGYGSLSGSRSVLLRWPASLPDPDIKVGGWIADVTYERNATVSNARFTGTYPGQRCHWYQIAKKSEVIADVANSYRQITVWTTTPLRAMSLMDFSTCQAVHVEAALIMPSVVNVYPRTIYTR